MSVELDALEMRDMRTLIALAAMALGIAGIDSASARPPHRYFARTAPLVVYDYQPGVIVRAYWLAPWRNRHYYPTTGDQPEVGRAEDLTAASGALEPAETFQRTWSTTSTFVLPEQPRSDAPARDATTDPRDEQFTQPPDRRKP